MQNKELLRLLKHQSHNSSENKKIKKRGDTEDGMLTVTVATRVIQGQGSFKVSVKTETSVSAF